MEFEDKDLAEWLEDVVRHILEKKANGIAFVAQSDDGETFTAYYNCGCCRKVEFAAHMQIDSVREIIEANREEDGEDEDPV